MRLELILTVSFVNFGFKYVRASHQTENKAVTSEADDGGRIRENIQNLFDSIVKNHGGQIELYRKTLKEEASKEQRAYDAMQDEIHFTRKKNSHKKVEFVKKNEMSENVQFKRAAMPPPTGCEVRGGTFLTPGQHIIDDHRCVVWYCSRRVELEDYGCGEIFNEQNRYPVFWSECNAADCYKGG